jgi:hypothetical protein
VFRYSTYRLVYVCPFYFFLGCNVNAVNNRNKLPLYLAIESRAHNQVHLTSFFLVTRTALDHLHIARC